MKLKETPIENELNPIIAFTILILITVIVSISIAVWVGSLSFGESTEINFHAQIYSTNHDIGILNEQAIFDISIENMLNTSRKFSIFVSADERKVYEETIELIELEKRNVVVNQKLRFIGLWTIEIFEENKIWYNYSFTTLANEEEAELDINRIDKIESTNNLLSNLGIVIVSALIVGIAVFWLYKYVIKKSDKR
jgi:hypothetical protein